MKKNGSSVLSPQAWKHLRDVKTADILVGIPSCNNAHTINYVVYQAANGLETYFEDYKSAIFVSDGRSTDGTLDTVKAMRLPFSVDVVPATYIGISGKGSAVKAIFEAAKFLEVEAVALVDSDLRSITPEWIKLLISPTLSGTEFVTPFYLRHKYDGTITNFICYPVTSSLYGKRVRQPIGGDFGISIELVKELLQSPLWQTPYIPRFGIDIFETHTALARKFEVKQAFLGSKVHEAKDPAKHLASMFRQVVGAMFSCIEYYEQSWKDIRGLNEVETIGGKSLRLGPEPIEVDTKNAIKSYRNGIDKYRKIYRDVLSDAVFDKIGKLKKTCGEGFFFPSEMWAKIVYSFAANFRSDKKRGRQELLDALRILWIGKVVSFVEETSDMNTQKAEEKVEEQVRVFKELKPYLLDIF